ncbi:YheC/YheD family protein [Paenibacillus koleovorans]|uniref:YheC/YheD family protein n=1 Tax=Paenibacillus koleovorans TaxID=121608 RepID=UPI000FD797E4|nr:YheC/YheD family protein [Paenibacillus koleovorans]
MNEPRVIGICVSADRPYVHEMAVKRLQMLGQAGNRNEWILFDRDRVNVKTRKVTGRRWGHGGQTFGTVEETIPCPPVVFVQCIAGRRWMEQLKRMGSQVFNDCMFDKWECWTTLAGDRRLRGVLPDTQLLTADPGLQLFLAKHRDIFLKPIDADLGHSSLGIVRLQLRENGSILASHESVLEMKTIEFDGFRSFYAWFYSYAGRNMYLMQQSIETEIRMNGVTDFRLHMNRKPRGQWVVSLVLLRIAHNRSHIVPKRAIMLPMHKWKAMSGNSPSQTRQIESIERSVIELGYRICSQLDGRGWHMADLGMDFGLDRQGQLWIFEINPLPSPLSLSADWYEGNAWTSPLVYAQSLLN